MQLAPKLAAPQWILAAVLPLVLAAADATVSQAPVCTRPSHERLVIREGRDVCGASLTQSGRPTAKGFMPTACRRDLDLYQIDAVGRADRCSRPSPVQGEKS